MIFCSNDDPRLIFTFFTARSTVNCGLFCVHFGETSRKTFNGKNLQHLTGVTQGLYENRSIHGHLFGGGKFVRGVFVTVP